jgi:hypothetical protein
MICSIVLFRLEYSVASILPFGFGYYVVFYCLRYGRVRVRKAEGVLYIIYSSSGNTKDRRPIKTTIAPP